MKRRQRSSAVAGLLAAVGALSGMAAGAQLPRITTLYPIGGAAGSNVEVEIRGSGLDGANLLLVHGAGMSGTVAPGKAKADETNKPVWEAKCGSCHELRSPANRSLSSAQWAATVERMVRSHNAPLSADEQTKVTQYLMSAARAGRVIANVKIAADAQPGMVEVRVATPKGVSSPRWFEVGRMPEVTGVNGTREHAQPVSLPCVANGCFMNGGERHFFGFDAKKGQRLVFDLKGYRYSDETQFYFSPVLRLYDSAGKQLAENHGHYDLDPLIDWTCPAVGRYAVEVRELLGRANPGSVYRLTMANVPYDTAVLPPAVPAGAQAKVRLVGENADMQECSFTVAAPAEPGVFQAPSSFGTQACYASKYPITRPQDSGAPAKAALPAGFAGRLVKAGQSDTFLVTGEGAFEFEGYAARLGSGASLAVALLNEDGSQAANVSGDGRMAATLEKGKTYKLTVSDGSGREHPNATYYVEARPARPGLELAAQPDAITVRPGVATPVEVIVTRRDGVEGDVTVTAENLPAGVSAATVVIPPDRDRGWLLLKGAADCGHCEQPIRILGTAKGPSGEVKVRALPQEVYRLSNDPRTRNWSECMLAVRGPADFAAQFVQPGPIGVDTQKPTELKVKIVRNGGFKGSITVSLVGLPQGWTADPQATEGDDVTLTVRTDGNDTAPFVKRDPKLSPIVVTLEASCNDFTYAFGTAVVEVVRSRANATGL